MTALDVAGLVVIGGRVLGIGSHAALGRLDIAAAEAALAEARSAGHEPGATFPDRAAVSLAGIGLVRALLHHRPFSEHGEQVAVAAGLQFLALNGWQADLDPPATAAVVVEALDSGRLSQADAATWLLPRLSPSPVLGLRRARTGVPLPGLRPLPSLRSLRALAVTGMFARSRMLASALLAIVFGSFALLATACSHGPGPAAAHPPAVRQSPRPMPAVAAGLAYAACMRSRGIGDFPGPSGSGVVVIVRSAGIDLNSSQFRSAEQACRKVAPVPSADIVVARAGRRH